MKKETEEEVILQLAAIKRSRWRLVRWGTVVIILGIVIGDQFLGWDITAQPYIVLAIVAACVIWIFTTWRCPVCNAFLGLNRNPRYCPNCKAKLR